MTDLPLLSSVGHPSAVNPDRDLRRAALERGWPILEFRTAAATRSAESGLRLVLVGAGCLVLGGLLSRVLVRMRRNSAILRDTPERAIFAVHKSFKVT